MVIRLNNKAYDEKKFVRNGIAHTDIFFDDGSTPKRDLIDKFLSVAEKEKGALGVHCKAGLGRTGTMIGCYAMKHYHFPAPAFIGWIRICRPGSVLGPQQYFLNEKQIEMFKLGEQSPIYKQVQALADKALVDKIKDLSLSDKQQTETIESKKIAQYGDGGQGEKLTGAKPVSYTHLTLPTKRIVQISVVAVSLKKKNYKKIIFKSTHRQINY
eukprot:TRINITY_DN2767_c0_g1_i5.p2 TRINITY_DN2767_c0_g1~~TRINITY_DN2767_c0_g1_i5.p2  ORF type:complete len:213 (+),score=45.45 TRINITY_DN2767_c0_g1_i5:663-1301(+)